MRLISGGKRARRHRSSGASGISLHTCFRRRILTEPWVYGHRMARVLIKSLIKSPLLPMITYFFFRQAPLHRRSSKPGALLMDQTHLARTAPSGILSRSSSATQQPGHQTILSRPFQLFLLRPIGCGIQRPPQQEQELGCLQ
jgi:hypothetical protein